MPEVERLPNLGRELEEAGILTRRLRPRLAEAIGHEPAEQVPLYNGKIPCRLLRFG